MKRGRSTPLLLILASVAFALAACGNSSPSSKSSLTATTIRRPAADVAACRRINGDIQRLYAQSQSTTEQQNPAALARTDQATAAKLRALVAAPGISPQLKSALTNTANTIEATATLQPNASHNVGAALQLGQQFIVDIARLRAACK